MGQISEDPIYTYTSRVPPVAPLKVEPSTLDVSLLDTCGGSSNNLFDSASIKPSVISS